MGEDFALAKCPEQSPPLASVTSVPAKRDHPGGLIPHCVGPWAEETQQLLCKGAGEALHLLLPGMLCFLPPLLLPPWEGDQI